MNRPLLGALAAMMLTAAGLFWWQGRAESEQGAELPAMAEASEEDEAILELPTASGRGMRGPQLPEADPASREERRFNRMDRDRDSRITRNEMLGLRVAAFRRLDTDGNNLLSFEEWAVKTSNRFKGADANGDGILNRPEFASTKPKDRPRTECRCPAGSDAEGGEPD